MQSFWGILTRTKSVVSALRTVSKKGLLLPCELVDSFPSNEALSLALCRCGV